MRPVVLILLVAACGDASPPTTRPAGAAISLVAPRANEADVIVAEVDGRPVWGSCVSTQAARGAPTREAALAECVDFELLAQAAEKRGLAADPEAVEAMRTAMVSQLVAKEFEDRYQQPTDLGARLDKVLAENAWRMHRPELRASTYVRIDVPEKASPDVDARARALAETIAAALATESGLMGSHVVAIADRLAAGTGFTVAHEDVSPSVRTSLEPGYAGALFTIPEVGKTSGPVRTPWGWDVILWSGGLTALERTREDLAAEIFPDLRRSMFTVWVNQIVKDLGVKIAIDPQQVARLDEATP